MTSNNGTTNNPSKESLQPTNAREGTTGAGWLAGKEPEQEGVAGRTGSSDAHPQSELQDQALSLLNALVMPHGPQYQPQAKDVEHVVAALQAEVPEKRIHEAIVSGIAGAERPAATVKRRCSGLWKLAGSSRRESESQGQAELVRPEWCGSCEDIDRTYFNAEGQLVQCPRCHPSIAGWVERVPA